MAKCDPPGLKEYPIEIFSGMRVRLDDETTAASTLTEPLISEMCHDGLEDDNTILMHHDNTTKDGKTCVVYNHDEYELECMHREFLSKAKIFASSIGFIIGCFIQFSSLGANFLLTSLWGYNVFYEREFVAVSLVWCFATSILGVMILLFLRGLVVVAFKASRAVSSSSLYVSQHDSKATQDFVAKLIVNIECCFAISSLVGVCLSWTMTDILLDMKGHIIHSLVTLMIALAWCKFVMQCCSRRYQENANRDLMDNDDCKTVDAVA